MVGSAVGPYQIVGRLGSGGMGEVFLGHDPRLQRRVALKALTTPETQAGEGRARVLREARAAARLNHPHIAGVYDVLEQDDRTFIVMEYVEGESLGDRLHRGPLPIGEVREIGRQLASALSAAHAQGVIHRDLKPANIHVARDGSIKVLDFGVAKLSSAAAAGPDVSTHQAAVDSSLEGNPGTPVYMSPEQLLDRDIDGRSDIYSAGVILYQMATGRRPYGEIGAVALGVAMAAAPPPAPRMLNAGVPEDLNAAILKALERDTANRFQTAHELEMALSTASSGRGDADAVLPAWSRRRLLWLGAAAMTVTVAVIGIALREPLLSLGRRGSTGTGPHAVIAVFPFENPTNNPRAEYVGAGLEAAVTTNLGSIAGMTVLTRTATGPFQQRRTDVAAIRQALSATHLVDLTIRSSAPRVVAIARLRRTSDGAVEWEHTAEGDALSVERTVLDELGRALERANVFSRRLTRDDWARIRRLPTSSAAALDAYSEARSLIQRYDVPGNVDRSIELLTTATRTDPRFAVAYAALGDALWRRYLVLDKRPEVAAMATAAVTKALEVDPNLPAVYNALGNMQFQTGRYAEAIQSLRRALQLNADSDESRRLLGRVLIASGDVEGGLAELRRAIQMRPDWSSYYALGYELYMHSRYAEALEAFQKTTELQPTFADGHQMLGTTYHAMGDLRNAIGNYEHAARLGPSANAYANLALAYYTAKRYDEALTAYLQAVERNPRKASLRRDLGAVYLELGRRADARAAFEKAIAFANDDLTVNPRDGTAVSIIAVCEAKIGRRAEAERHAAEAVVLSPNDRDVRIRVTKTYVEVRDRAAALDALRAAVALGWEPKMVREDHELSRLHSDRDFEKTIAAGTAARAQVNDGKAKGEAK